MVGRNESDSSFSVVHWEPNLDLGGVLICGFYGITLKWQKILSANSVTFPENIKVIF